MVPDDFLHRSGRCGDMSCVTIAKEEISLGLPMDPAAREAWYAVQAKRFAPWRNNMYRHRWYFHDGLCSHCEAKGLVVKAGRLSLCVEWCLNTNAPRYPSGHQQPCLSDLIAHTKSCTSHLSSLTSKHIERLGTLYGLSSHTAGMERYGHTFLSKKVAKPKTSSSRSPSPNSGSFTLTLPGFSTQKN